MLIWQIDPASLTPYYDLALCHALAEAGSRVRFVTSRYLYDPTLMYPSNVEVDIHYFKLLQLPLLLHLPLLRKALRGLLYPFGHLKLFAKLWMQPPDIVHLQWSRLPIFDRWLLLWVRRLGLPVVHTVHDVEPLFMQGRLSGNLLQVYQQVDRLIVHSEENRTRFLRKYPSISPEKVEIIPVLLPMLKVFAAEQTRNAARSALGTEPGRFVVMCFGGVKQYKGVDILAEAIPQVLVQNPAVQFWVVGKPEGAVERALLERLSQVAQVEVRARYIPSDEIWKYHMAADVMVFPYRKITQSAALATALHYGCAVIVTRVGGLPEMVRDNGWIVPPEQPEAIAQSILEASQQPDKLAAMRERSKALASEMFDPAVIARQYLELYVRVAAERKGRA